MSPQRTQRFVIASTVALAAALWTSGAASAQGTGYSPARYYQLVGVSEVAVAPDGAHVAFTVTTIVEDENRRHREIWLQPLEDGRADGDAFPVTSPTEESSGPRWSPDGSLLAFTSSRGDDPNSVWFVRVRGPGWRSIPHRGCGRVAGMVSGRVADRVREHP